MVQVFSSAVITNNFFDSNTVDGSSLFTIINTSIGWIIRDNVGQTATIIFEGDLGTMGIRTSATNGVYYASGVNPTSGTTTAYVGPTIELDSSTLTAPALIFQADGNSNTGFNWSIPLVNVIPPNAYLVGVSFTASATTQFSGSADLLVFIRNASGFVTSGSETAPLQYQFGSGGSYVANTVKTLSFTVPYGAVKVGADGVTGKLPSLVLKAFPIYDSGGGILNINPISITYRW